MAVVNVYTPTSLLGLKRDVFLNKGERPNYGLETCYDYYTLAAALVLYEAFKQHRPSQD